MALTHPLPAGQVATWAGAVAFSRDGQRLAYVVDGQLYLKHMDEADGRLIPGSSEGSMAPFFSPDGREVAYAAGQQLWKIPAAGGSPVLLARVGPWFYGGTWGEDGNLIFANAEGVSRVPADGDPVEMLIPTTDPEDAFGPSILPGGEWLLFTLATSSGSDRWNEAQVVAQSLRSDERRVITTGSDARYLRTGHLVYAVGDILYGVGFDRQSMSVDGVPVALVEPMQRAGNPIYNGGTANYDVSDSGTFAFVPDVPTGSASLVRIDRQGNAEPLHDLGDLVVARLRLSPDGERLVFATSEPADIWVYDIPRRRLRSLTEGDGNRWPEWVDDSLVAFTSGRAGFDNIFVQRWDRADEPVQITRYDYDVHLNASTGDGRRLAIHKHSTPDGPNVPTILMLDVESADGIAVASEFELPSGGVQSFSPDGTWTAYGSGGEIYVTTTDGRGSLIPVSPDGGQWPRWTESGEIVYRNGDQVVAIEVQTEPELRVGDPVVLFEGRYERGPGTGNFEVAADGQSFVMVTREQVDPELLTPGRQINIVLNWFTVLTEQVPR